MHVGRSPGRLAMGENGYTPVAHNGGDLGSAAVNQGQRTTASLAQKFGDCISEGNQGNLGNQFEN